MAKFLKLSEAVEEVVRDGDTAAFEGFTHLIPYAAATRPFASAAKS
jgi:glutaconate CoA-transferase subunit A